jgi:hypothetical protein
MELANLTEGNSSMSYPLDNEQQAKSMLAGRPMGIHRATKMVSDLVDVFGDDVSIISGDEVQVYDQVNSTDDSIIYVVIRKNMQFARTFYIPSKYKSTDQLDLIQSAI